jgi:hypothetical protein
VAKLYIVMFFYKKKLVSTIAIAWWLKVILHKIFFP